MSGDRRGDTFTGGTAGRTHHALFRLEAIRSGRFAGGAATEGLPEEEESEAGGGTTCSAARKPGRLRVRGLGTSGGRGCAAGRGRVGERRELDNLSSKALQSKVVSDFLRKKELDGRSYEPDNWAPLEDQQSAVTTIEARWLSYMQR